MLHRVNLLDWRDAHQRRQRVVTVGLSVLLLLCFVAFQAALCVVTNQKDKALREDQARLMIPQTELEQQLNKIRSDQREVEQLSHVLAHKQRIDHHRLRIFMLKTLIVKSIPDTIYLDTMTLNQLSVTIDGVSPLADTIAVFIEVLQASPLIRDVKIRSVLPASSRWSASFQSFSLTFEFADNASDQWIGHNNEP